MEMDEKPIGLRDEKAEILDKAHLDEQQLNNLTYVANQTHRVLVDEQTRWADPTLDWKAIPTEDMNKALEMMQDRGKAILDKVPHVQRGPVIRNRLYQTRRNWRDQTRRRRQKDAMGADQSSSDQPSRAQPTSEEKTDEMGQIIKQGGWRT